MEQLLIQVRDEAKAKMLIDLLNALDFVDSVKTVGLGGTRKAQADLKEDQDFFALAGLWAGREISLESIRQKAWPRQ